MIDLDELQNRIFQNKIDNCFELTDNYNEFDYKSRDMSEAFEASIKNRDGFSKELTDIVIHLLKKHHFMHN